MKEESILEEYLKSVCAKCAHFKERLKPCRKQPIGILHPETETCTRFEEKCCGNCCWFYGEDTDGWGQCPLQDIDINSMHCSDMCEDDYVSRQEMRHHMAVLIQFNRHLKRCWMYSCPMMREVWAAQEFAYKYMKVFSKL